MKKHVVARLKDLPPGTRKIVEVERRSIGVFNVRGELYALRNSCPHQGAPLCLGRILGMAYASAPYKLEYRPENEVVKCPWHGWEFEIATGRSVFNPHKVRVRTYEVTIEPPVEEEEDPTVETYPVTVEDGLVIVHL